MVEGRIAVVLDKFPNLAMKMPHHPTWQLHPDRGVLPQQPVKIDRGARGRDQADREFKPFSQFFTPPQPGGQ